MSYTGKVRPGGPADVRELTELVISKISVGPMDNNAYLLRCRMTGEQLLVDAANEPDRLLDLVGAGRPGRGGHHPPARRPLAGAGRGGRGDRRPDLRPPVGRTEIPVETEVFLSRRRQPALRGGGAARSIHLVGHTPGSIALVYDDPDGEPARLHRRLPVPRRRGADDEPGGLRARCCPA